MQAYGAYGAYAANPYWNLAAAANQSQQSNLQQPHIPTSGSNNLNSSLQQSNATAAMMGNYVPTYQAQ